MLVLRTQSCIGFAAYEVFKECINFITAEAVLFSFILGVDVEDGEIRK